MAECPNCGAQVDGDVRLCPKCGFDTGEAQAERVRELREQGQIHPGRLNPEGQEDVRGGDPSESAPHHEELPAEDTPLTDPRQIEGGL